MKKMIALAVSLSLLGPVAHAGLMKKLIIGGAIVYGANALAQNHKQKRQQEQYQQYPNQHYQVNPQYHQPSQYGQPYNQYQREPQVYRSPQYQPNQVNRPYSPNY